MITPITWVIDFGVSLPLLGGFRWESPPTSRRCTFLELKTQPAYQVTNYCQKISPISQTTLNLSIYLSLASVAWPPPGVTPLAAIGSGTDLQQFIFHYASANFTSYSTSPTIISCTVKNSAGTTVSGSCYSQTAGFGPWGNILIPLTLSSLPADCYTVSLQFKVFFFFFFWCLSLHKD